MYSVVDTTSKLYSINNSDTDQVVFVKREQSFYYLVNWSRRGYPDGWRKTSTGEASVPIANSTNSTVPVHNLVNPVTHPVVGLTPGHVMTAISANNYEFQALPGALSMFTVEGTAPNQYIRCSLPFASDGEIQAFTDQGQFPPTIWESMPLATSSSIGGIQLTTANPATKFLREDGIWQTVTSGTFDHSSLSNLSYAASGHTGFAPSSHSHAWGDITSGIPSSFTPDNHSLVSSTHTVSGLTNGHFLRATGATTYGFGALVEADVTGVLTNWFTLEGTAPNQYIRCKYPFAGDYEIQAFSSTGWLPGNIWDDLPTASATIKGGIKVGTTLSIDPVTAILNVAANAGLPSFGATEQLKYLRVKADYTQGTEWVTVSAAYLPLAGGTLTGGLGINMTNPYIQYKVSGTEIGIMGSDAAIYGGTATNFGIYVYGNNELALSTNNTKRLTILGGGNVGIGTTTPYSGLELAKSGAGYWNGSTDWTNQSPPLSTLTISNTTNGGYDPLLLFRQTDSGAASKNAGAIGLVGRSTWTSGNNASQISDMYFAVRNAAGGISERMRIMSDGNVGIGTTTPSAKLDVNGVINVAAGNGIWWGGTNVRQIYESGGSLYVRTNSLDRLTILSDGNVGIGTTAPTEKLHVNGVIAIEPVVQTAFGNGSRFKFRRISDSWTPCGIEQLYDSAIGGYGGQLAFFVNTGASVTSVEEAMRIDGAKRVGIGTTAPQQPLHVVGNTPLRLERTGVEKYEFEISNNGTDDILNITSIDQAKYLVTFASSGKVGIGTTAPDTLLHIYNNAAGITNQLTLNNYNTTAGYDGTAIFFKGYQGSLAKISGFGDPQNSTGGDLHIQTYSDNTTANTGIYLNRLGNVGIGTTAPDYLLTLSKSSSPTIHLIEGSSHLYASIDAGAVNFERSAASTFNIKRGSVSNIYVTADDKVGIGTTSPQTKLDINKDAVYTDYLGQLLLSGATNSAKRLAIGFDTSNDIGFLQAYTNGVGVKPLSLQPNGGNVGIGTTAPSQLLHVQSGVLEISNGDIDNSERVQTIFSARGYPTSYLHKISTAHSGTITQGWMKFSLASGASTYNDVLFLRQDGNVGIGTTSPYEKLSVNGNMSLYNELTFDETTNGTASGYINYHGYQGGASQFRHLYICDGKQNIFTTFDGVNQRVGIGNTSPSEKLHVTGNILATGEVTAYYSSDLRLKSNIRDFTALNIIDQLNPKIYNWNAKAKELNSTKDLEINNYGLIAQDLQKVLPELIKPIHTDYLAIDYIQIVPILIQSIKELRQEIKDLKHG